MRSDCIFYSTFQYTHKHTHTASCTHLRTAGAELSVCVCVCVCTKMQCKEIAVQLFISLRAIKYSTTGKELKCDPPQSCGERLAGKQTWAIIRARWTDASSRPPEIQLDGRWNAHEGDGKGWGPQNRHLNPARPDGSASLEAKEINHDRTDVKYDCVICQPVLCRRQCIEKASEKWMKCLSKEYVPRI